MGQILNGLQNIIFLKIFVHFFHLQHGNQHRETDIHSVISLSATSSKDNITSNGHTVYGY